MLDQLFRDIIGPSSRRYLPLLGSMFIFIFVANVMGTIPGFLPPTERWETNVAIATISFLAYNYFGFRAHGVAYLKHFTAPISLKGVKGILMGIVLIVPLMMFQTIFGAVEILSNLLRPTILTIRLMANITADHAMLEAFSGLAPYLVPLPVLILGLFVSFVQAFIFTVLSSVYISLAVAKDH